MNKSNWHERNKEKVREYMREYSKKYRAANRDKKREAHRKWYAANRETQLAKGRSRYAEKWAAWLKYKYGITAEDYFAMLAAQESVCAICRAHEPGGRFKNNRFHVDHCHTSGRVRQLLCNACNHLLGCARDKPDVLRTAATYLERHALLVLTSEKKSS